MPLVLDKSGIETGLANSPASLLSLLNLIESYINGQEAGSNPFTQLSLGAATEVTIDADGAIAITGSHYTVDTYGDAASDELKTINGGSEGDMLYLRLANAARTVTFKHNTGNIYFPNAADYTLDDANITLAFKYNGTKWANVSLPMSSSSDYGAAIVPMTVLTGSAASISLTSIPATYGALRLILAARTDASAVYNTVGVTFNGDTTITNYYSLSAQHYHNAQYSTVESLGTQVGGWLTYCAAGGSAPAGYRGMADILIPAYATTGYPRVVMAEMFRPEGDSSGNIKLNRAGFTWKNTADAISSITLTPSGGNNFLAGTAYALYGVS